MPGSDRPFDAVPCEDCRGVPQKLEHDDIRWIAADEIDEYAFCPADEEILRRLKR